MMLQALSATCTVVSTESSITVLHSSQLSFQQIVLTLLKWLFPKTGGSPYRPQNTIVLIIGTPKMVPLIFGNPQILSQPEPPVRALVRAPSDRDPDSSFGKALVAWGFLQSLGFRAGSPYYKGHKTLWYICIYTYIYISIYWGPVKKLSYYILHPKP